MLHNWTYARALRLRPSWSDGRVRTPIEARSGIGHFRPFKEAPSLRTEVAPIGAGFDRTSTLLSVEAFNRYSKIRAYSKPDW
jgi:hypothetical protein